MATKKILEVLFHMDFFKNQKLTTKHLYLLYTLMAGIYYESYVHKWFRYFTKIFFIIALLDGIVNCSITISQWKDIDIPLFIICVSTITILLCTSLVVLMNYYWREDLRTSFEMIDEYSKSHEENNGMVGEEEQSYTSIDYNKYLKFHYIFLMSVLHILCWYGKLIKVCLTVKESSDINSYYTFTYPVQYLTHLNWSEYVFMYFLQIIFLLPFFTILLISIIIQVLFSIIIRNQVILLVNEIKFESNSITMLLDRFYEQEIEILGAKTSIKNKNLELSNISRERKSCYERFTNHTKKWIFRYQKLFTAMSLLKNYFAAISSIILLGLTISGMCVAYASIMTLDAKSTEYFFYIVFAIFGIFAFCMTGHLYDSMMDELEKEIYAMPWYYLPPTQRKLILNFLSIVQKRCTLKAFKVYPLKLNLYPQVLMKIFSWLQILRVMEAKLKA